MGKTIQRLYVGDVVTMPGAMGWIRVTVVEVHGNGTFTDDLGRVRRIADILK